MKSRNCRTLHIIYIYGGEIEPKLFIKLLDMSFHVVPSGNCSQFAMEVSGNGAHPQMNGFWGTQCSNNPSYSSVTATPKKIKPYQV